MEHIHDDAFGSAKRLMVDLLRVRPALQSREVTTRIKEALQSAERQWALYLLMIVDVDMTRQVLPELLQAGLRHRDAVLVREIIGRLPRRVLAIDLPPLIEDRMSTADEDEFRRMAELLDHLGLVEALNSIVQQAMEGDDPGIRDAAEDFSH
jgi:hypothetical protein